MIKSITVLCPKTNNEYTYYNHPNETGLWQLRVVYAGFGMRDCIEYGTVKWYCPACQLDHTEKNTH